MLLLLSHHTNFSPLLPRNIKIWSTILNLCLRYSTTLLPSPRLYVTHEYFSHTQWHRRSFADGKPCSTLLSLTCLKISLASCFGGTGYRCHKAVICSHVARDRFIEATCVFWSRKFSGNSRIPDGEGELFVLHVLMWLILLGGVFFVFRAKIAGLFWFGGGKPYASTYYWRLRGFFGVRFSSGCFDNENSGLNLIWNW